MAWQDGRTVAAVTCCAGRESSDPGGSVQGRVFLRKNLLNMPLRPFFLTSAANAVWGGRGKYRTRQRFPRRSSAARSVLAISMATVIGPTPPGTGVIQPATSLTAP